VALESVDRVEVRDPTMPAPLMGVGSREARVESKRGAVTWGNSDLPSSRFLSPLIEPDMRISLIRLSS
jgi:hypothetical protein